MVLSIYSNSTVLWFCTVFCIHVKLYLWEVGWGLWGKEVGNPARLLIWARKDHSEFKGFWNFHIHWGAFVKTPKVCFWARPGKMLMTTLLALQMWPITLRMLLDFHQPLPEWIKDNEICCPTSSGRPQVPLPRLSSLDTLQHCVEGPLLF